MTDRELIQQVLDDICGARLCEINSMSSRHEMLRLLDKAITALRDRLAQPEQEPVAWMHKFIRDNIITHNPADINRHPERWTPLYTAPQPRQWQGLTDQELSQAYCEVSGKEWCLGGLSNAHTFYEAIEAKLKEKNK